MSDEVPISLKADGEKGPGERVPGARGGTLPQTASVLSVYRARKIIHSEMKSSLLKNPSAFATLASSGVSKLEKMKIRNVKSKKKILSSHCWSMV